jgi:hypothetical protein
VGDVFRMDGLPFGSGAWVVESVNREQHLFPPTVF